MKSILSGVVVLIITIFPLTAIVVHLWTVYIAFSVGGFWGGIISLFLPVLSEVYWMFKMFGIQDFYAWITLIHIILTIPVTLLSKKE